VVWSLIAVVLAVFVLRRSNTARILLVISASVVAVLSLLTIAGGATVVTLVASVATILLLFVGGAGDWFKRTGGHPGAYPAPYDSSPSGASSYGDPYGAQGGQDDPYGPPPGQDDPYGQRPTEGGADHPPKDYPGR
jgi:hypothetical protein